MCQFLSAVVLKSGKILMDPEHTDSHSDLLRANNLKDNEQSLLREKFARIEFVPPEDVSQVINLSKWRLILDEQRTVSWWDAKKDEVREKLEVEVGKHILSSGEHDLLLGGWYILAGDVVVQEAKNVNIKLMLDNSQVEIIRNNSQIGEMRRSSQVEIMYEDSQVKEMLGRSQVGEMRRSSQVGEMRDDSQVGRMYNKATICEDKREKQK